MPAAAEIMRPWALSLTRSRGLLSRNLPISRRSSRAPRCRRTVSGRGLAIAGNLDLLPADSRDVLGDAPPAHGRDLSRLPGRTDAHAPALPGRLGTRGRAGLDILGRPRAPGRGAAGCLAGIAARARCRVRPAGRDDGPGLRVSPTTSKAAGPTWSPISGPWRANHAAHSRVIEPRSSWRILVDLYARSCVLSRDHAREGVDSNGRSRQLRA